MQYINAIDYLKKTFERNTIVLANKYSAEIDRELFNRAFNKIISTENPLEGNLRMIESYMPEILYCMALNCESGENITTIIKTCSKLKFPYQSIINSRRFLQFKMQYLFEAILFADVFENVWNGKWINRNFAIKKSNELQYFQMHNSRELIWMLFDMTYMKTSKNGNIIEMKFAFN